MGRYLKYLEIVNKIDAAIEQKAAGKVDIDKAVLSLTVDANSAQP